MKLLVSVKCRAVGFHYWPNPPKEFGYLGDRHRHEFVIICKKEVAHADRDVEVNELKQQIEDYLSNKYGRPCEFGHMSCEHIASELLTTFRLVSCEVLEDGLNGAVAMEGDL